MSRRSIRSRTGRRHRLDAAASAEAARQLSLTLEWAPPSKAAPSAPAPAPAHPAPRSTAASDLAVGDSAGIACAQDHPHSSEAILRLPAVKAATGLCRSVIYERIRKGTFPRPITLGPKSVGWPASVVSEWVQQTIKSTQKARA